MSPVSEQFLHSRPNGQMHTSKMSRGWQPIQAHDASSSLEGEGDAAKDEEIPVHPVLKFWNHHKARWMSLQQQLRDLGPAGLVAYGVLNTAYYCVAFVFFWFFVAQVESGQGYDEAVKQILAVLAMVWAGSQVTKLARIGAAVLLAPVIENLAQFLMKRFKLQSSYVAYGMLTASCFAVTATVFGTILVLCAF